MIFLDMEKIVFAGDSVTDMGSTNPVGEGFKEGLGHGYVRMVDNLLCACYPERRIRVINSGISGNTTRALRARWERDVLSMDPDYVSICIGINDVWRQFDCPARPDTAVELQEYEENLIYMIESVRGQVKKIFLMTPYYMEPNKQDTMRMRMDEYSDVVRKLAKTYECELIDLQAMFDGYFVHRHSTFIAWDRVHPSEAGATLIAKEFLRHCGFEFYHESN